MHGRRVVHARGKVLGGSSSINGMIFQRGNALDFERWSADPGMQSWNYAHCLPYFKRMETCEAGADAWRGGDGPLLLERGPATNPLFSAFFEATRQAGYPATDDVNGYRQEGFAKFDRNVSRGRRLSAARAYLHPVCTAPNLKVRTLAQVTRVLFEGKRAVAVEYAQAGRGSTTSAGRRGDSLRRRDQYAAAVATLGRGQCGTAAATGHRCRGRRAWCRRQSAGPSRGLRPVCQQGCLAFPWIRASRGCDASASARSGCSCARASARPITSRVAGSVAAMTTSITRT